MSNATSKKAFGFYILLFSAAAALAAGKIGRAHV